MRMLLIPLNFNGTNPEAFEAPEDPGPGAGATSAARNPRYQEGDQAVPDKLEEIVIGHVMASVMPNVCISALLDQNADHYTAK